MRLYYKCVILLASSAALVGCVAESPTVPTLPPAMPWGNAPLVPVTPPPPELAWTPPLTPLQRLGLDGFVADAKPAGAPRTTPRRPILPPDAPSGPVKRIVVTAQQIVSIPTHPSQPTYLFLPEGERLAAPLALDEAQWASGLVEMGKEALRRETVVVRPLVPGIMLHTGLLFQSGLYFFLRLEAASKPGWLGVEFATAMPHPLAEPSMPTREQPPALPPQINLAAYSEAFTISVRKGKPMAWLPAKAFRDDANTFLVFSRRLTHTRAPVAYGIAAKKKRILVEQQPYIHPDPTRGQLMMIKGLWDAIELQDSAGAVVRIVSDTP